MYFNDRTESVFTFTTYTPQNDLRTNRFIFPLFNIEIDVYSFNLWAKEIFAVFFRYAKHIGNINSYQNVNVSKKIRPEDSEKKGNFWKSSFNPKMKYCQKFWNFLYFLKKNYDTQSIWDKRHKDKVRKRELPFEMW